MSNSPEGASAERCWRSASFLGGLIVSLFAVAGDLFQAEDVAGLFGAAPSVALTTLAIAYATKGSPNVAVEARSMVLGSVAFSSSTVSCASRRRGRNGRRCGRGGARVGRLGRRRLLVVGAAVARSRRHDTERERRTDQEDDVLGARRAVPPSAGVVPPGTGLITHYIGPSSGGLFLAFPRRSCRRA
jgi:hypothetical protein